MNQKGILVSESLGKSAVKVCVLCVVPMFVKTNNQLFAPCSSIVFFAISPHSLLRRRSKALRERKSSDTFVFAPSEQHV